MTEENVFDPIDAAQRRAAVEEENVTLKGELAKARAQRDAVGQLLHHWVGRYFALKAAHGDIPLAAAGPLAERELTQAQDAVNAVQAPE